MTVRITLPEPDIAVQMHHDDANSAIAAMSPSRSYGAETSFNCWRRHLSIVYPNGSDGYAFPGTTLRPGAEVSVPLDGLILAVDASWAKAKWYAGQYIKPLERWATLYVVEEAGPQQLTATNSQRWASEILGFLSTNPDLCKRAGVSFGPPPRIEARSLLARR